MLSTSDKKIIKAKNSAVLDLQDEHLCSQKDDLKYVVTNLKIRDLRFHPSVYEKVNGSEIKRAALKTNGSHPVLIQANGDDFGIIQILLN